MKKIMFNDNYGLTKAVLEGRKTQTRRLVKCPKTFNGVYVSGFRVSRNAAGDWLTYLVDEDEQETDGSYLKSAYVVGEEVAVAQSYKDAGCDFYFHRGLAGWNNKMFVRSEEMPHHIKITNVRVERLQDISDEDCLKEGIKASGVVKGYWYVMGGTTSNDKIRRESARMAYADLIDKTCGKGTWENNPWVFVYDFELIR